MVSLSLSDCVSGPSVVELSLVRYRRSSVVLDNQVLAMGLNGLCKLGLSHSRHTSFV